MDTPSLEGEVSSLPGGLEGRILEKYRIELIDIGEKEEFMERYRDRILYEDKAEIYGCCIKLLTDLRYVKEKWEDNFYPMSASVRSHGRLLVMEEEGRPLTVKYDPLSKTAILINVDYYGWVKSLALSVAGDILEDEHGIYSIHGACIDLDGKGIALIAPSGTGKTTHTYGLLRLKDIRAVADDWFFIRLYGEEALAFGSEKNFYVQADIAKIWGEYHRLVDKAEIDEEGRAVVNVRWIVGKGRIIPLTTLRKVILLQRDPRERKDVRRLTPEEALDYILANGFCNPHLLVKDERKLALRTDFYRRLFSFTEIYMVNTITPPSKTNENIQEIVRKERGSSD